MLQNLAYNGHKRKHSVKFQAFCAPEVLIVHGLGPLEGRRHDWTLYLRSELDEQLSPILVVEGNQYCLYGIVHTARESTCRYLPRGIMCLMRSALTTLQFYLVTLECNEFSNKSSSTGPLWTLSERCASTSPL